MILKNEWAPYLNGEFEKPYYLKLRAFLMEEYRTKVVYPEDKDLFNALLLTDYSKVKVVILGQDPYHGPNQAHGLSFSVLPSVQTPPSLKNIYKELHRDLGCSIPNHGCLVKWAEQGVLLLNTSLSVRKGEPNAHAQIGWSEFTAQVIRSLNVHKTPVVFLLWGKHALSLAGLIDHPMHLKLTAAHPSPLSANRGFFGCSHFSKTNEFLIDHHMSPIDWQIDSL